MQSSRRDFLRGMGGVASLAALGGCACPFCGCGAPKRAAQLYSIRRLIWQNPEACLAELRRAGFDGVEFAGFGGHSAREIRAYLDNAGIIGMGAHVNGFVELKGDGLKKTLDFCAEAGLESVTTPHAICSTRDEYRQFGHDMSLAAEAARAYGIKVGIHTTYEHFTVKYGEEFALDAIFAEASPLLQQQIDTSNSFHVIGAGLIPLLRKYRGRHFSVHLKENVPSATGTLGERPTDGGPIVPWKDVFECLAADRVAWYVIEAEVLPDSYDPLKRSLAFLNANA